MKVKSRMVLLVLMVIVALSTVACEKEGDAEKAGKKIDEVFNTAKDKIKDVTK